MKDEVCDVGPVALGRVALVCQQIALKDLLGELPQYSGKTSWKLHEAVIML